MPVEPAGDTNQPSPPRAGLPMTYNPAPDSLAAKVITHLKNYPSKKLRVAEICDLFGTKPANVPPCLGPATNHGVLVRDKDAESFYYRAGPALHSVTFSVAAAAEVKPAPTITPIQWLEQHGLTIESGVAMATKPRKVTMGSMVADKVLAMSVGDSFSVPDAVWKPLRFSLASVTKNTGVVLKSAPDPKAPGQTRVWRVAK